MFYKLNSEPSSVPAENRCNIGTETSDSDMEIDPNKKKDQVRNYKTVMLDEFKIPLDSYFNAIPINVNHLKAFIEKNGPNLEACRVYITKDSSDPNQQDYELLFIPCIPKFDADGQLEYYEDNLGQTNKSYSFSAKCRRPPGCGKGSLL